MIQHGKKYKQANDGLVRGEVHSPREGIALVKARAYASFDETIDANIVLGIDATKGDQVVRGSVILPHSIGKTARVIVFAKGEHADQAQKAGADVIGADDLVEKILGGWMDFTHAVATPDLMGIVGKVAKILGPRGLLPNKKLGKVTFDVGQVVTELKQGRLFFKNDKNGSVNFTFGRKSLSEDKLLENLTVFLRHLSAAKPTTSKGVFLKKITLSSTMGPGVQVSGDSE